MVMEIWTSFKKLDNFNLLQYLTVQACLNTIQCIFHTEMKYGDGNLNFF